MMSASNGTGNPLFIQWASLLFSNLAHIVNDMEAPSIAPHIAAVLRLLQETGIVAEACAPAHSATGKPGFDTLIRLPAVKVTLGVWEVPSLSPGVIDGLLRRLPPSPPRVTLIPLILTPRLTRNTLRVCRELKLCVLDQQGNAYIRLPGVYIERFVESPMPARPRVVGTVFTARASRLARAFLARPNQAWVQAELGRATGLTPGYVSVLVKDMLAQNYIRRQGAALLLAEPDRLLDDWLAHYRFDRHHKRQFALAVNGYEQGLRKVAAALGVAGTIFAWTGWSGAFLRAPYGTTPTYMAYVKTMPDVGALKVIFPVEQDGNVILCVPHDAGVFQFTSDAGRHGPVVSDAQLYLDLVKMPGRAKEQAEHLREKCLRYTAEPR